MRDNSAGFVPALRAGCAAGFLHQERKGREVKDKAGTMGRAQFMAFRGLAQISED
jgi:hypothetical protein